MSYARIPFNSPYLTGNELGLIQDAYERGQLSGDGYYTKLASQYISEKLGVQKVLITHSCTAALEMCALLLQLKEGDEVIMPSYTFVSTASAFVLRGAKPVFVDVDPHTFNIDPDQIEQAITTRTRCIVVVHYAGVCCDMDRVLTLAAAHGIKVVEDAAQAFYSRYKSRYLGTLGCLSAFSFHETKNIISGEGGCLVINDSDFDSQAEVIREKGTNRSQFFRGEVDKYTWISAGSSYLPGEITSAFLTAQLMQSESITARRLEKWHSYKNLFADYVEAGRVQSSSIPSFCTSNAHMFFLVLSNLEDRTSFIQHMMSQGIQCVFHYVPLHTSPAGQKFGRHIGSMSNTMKAHECLVRLPMGTNVDTDYIFNAASKYLRK